MVTSRDRLAEILPIWYRLISGWSIDGTLLRAAGDVFHLDDGFAAPQALGSLNSFLQQWGAGNFRSFPSIELLSADAISGANGAYAASTDTIYLNQEWLQTASDVDILKVLTEELGHYLDDQLKLVDTSGDEGLAFSQALFGANQVTRSATTESGLISVDGQLITAEFASTARDFAVGQYRIAPLGASGAGLNTVSGAYFYAWQTVVGTTALSEFLATPYSSALAEAYRMPSGIDAWTIWKDSTKTDYVTLIAPKVEEISFNGVYLANGGGDANAQISLADRNGNTWGFKAGGADDFVFGEYSLFFNTLTSNLFVAAGGAGLDTLQIPRTQANHLGLERNALGLARVRYNDSNSQESQYILTGFERVDYVDKRWLPTSPSDYNLVNSNNYSGTSAVYQVSATSFAGTSTSVSSNGTTGNDLMLGAILGDQTVYTSFDGLAGTDVLALPRWTRAQLTNIQRTSTAPSTWRLTFGGVVINAVNIENLLLFDSAVSLNADGTTTDLPWLPDVPDTAPPTVTASTVNGSVLVLTLSEALKSTLPDVARFAVIVNGFARAVSTVSVNTAAATVTLNLVSAVSAGQTVTVAYTDASPTDDSVGVVEDAVGNDLATFAARAVTNQTPDTTPPTVVSRTVNGAVLTLTLSETLKATLPDPARFTVLVNGVARAVSSTAVNPTAKTVTLNLASAVATGQTVTVAYADPTSANDTTAVIEDAVGNDLLSFTAQAVTNLTNSDSSPPAVVAQSINGSVLTLTFSEVLKATTPAASQFTVLVNGVARAVSSVSVNPTGRAVALTLASAVARGQTVSVAYQDASTANDATSVVEDAAGNDLNSFTARSVVNLTTGGRNLFFGDGLGTATSTPRFQAVDDDFFNSLYYLETPFSATPLGTGSAYADGYVNSLNPAETLYDYLDTPAEVRAPITWNFSSSSEFIEIGSGFKLDVIDPVTGFSAEVASHSYENDLFSLGAGSDYFFVRDILLPYGDFDATKYYGPWDKALEGGYGFAVNGGAGADRIVVRLDVYDNGYDFTVDRFDAPSVVVIPVVSVIGDVGNDNISVYGASAIVQAGADSDVVEGSQFSDVILGGAGNDVLTGSPISIPRYTLGVVFRQALLEKDVLVGGSGADTFCLARADAYAMNGTSDFAVITDFESGDRISTVFYRGDLVIQPGAGSVVVGSNAYAYNSRLYLDNDENAAFSAGDELLAYVGGPATLTSSSIVYAL